MQLICTIPISVFQNYVVIRFGCSVFSSKIYITVYIAKFKFVQCCISDILLVRKNVNVIASFIYLRTLKEVCCKKTHLHFYIEELYISLENEDGEKNFLL